MSEARGIPVDRSIQSAQSSGTNSSYGSTNDNNLRLRAALGIASKDEVLKDTLLHCNTVFPVRKSSYVPFHKSDLQT